MQQCKIVINFAVAAAILFSRVILYILILTFFHFNVAFRVGALGLRF